jgi:general secretion pathway protein G
MRRTYIRQNYPDEASGYTLVELLVVLTILGLLAALAAPQMIKYMEHGQRAAAATQSATLTASLHLFRADVGRYPTTAEGLDVLLAPPADAENWSGPYVKSASALNDPWGHRFIYRSPGTRGEFDLLSAGPPVAKTNTAKAAVP